MPPPLSPELRQRLRAALQQMLDRYPNPSRAQSEVARQLRVKPSTISRIVSGDEGGSLDMISRVSAALNDPPEKILRGTAAERPVRKLRELDGFREAMADSINRIGREYPGLTRLHLEKAADARLDPEPEEPLSPQLLIVVACNQRKRETLPPSGRHKRAKRIS
jgi:transcriptional regulator with XRE-family HTH domain